MGEQFDTAFLTQLVVSGIAFGSIYAMVAIGFNIIYNATGIINLAQGEFVMLGGMGLVWAHETLALPVWAAALATVHPHRADHDHRDDRGLVPVPGRRVAVVG